MDALSYPVLDPRSPAAASRAVRPGACALAVMIKAPCPGASKTRLTPPLTPVEAAALSECFLRDTTANIAQVTWAADANGGAPAAGVAIYTPVGMESAFNGLLPEGFVLLAQHEEPLGERLFHAIEDLLALGYGSVCLIDSDSPTLPAASLAAAVEALSRPGDRLVIGPSQDGGYYLIGLKTPHRRLFEDIDWSTERVAAQTLQRAAEIGLEVEQLPIWYDVDDAETLRALCEELFSREQTEMWLAPEAALTAALPDCPELQPSGFLFPLLVFGEHHSSAGYAAPRTREFLARLLSEEGRARLWPEAPEEEADSPRP
jgi:rSAM/selenodomain-associated transferase 1